MDAVKAINITVGCILASGLDTSEKREVVSKIRGFEEIVELIEYKEYEDSELIEMIEKIIKK
ncbi:hypothetical protein AB1K09_20225 [Solibacillus silvestris]